jgi:hypothetical protein
MIDIVCYAGGTGGDLVCAMIDPTGAVLIGNTIKHAPERVRLKKPHLFDSDDDRHAYIKSVSEVYKSIPSHDLDFHLRHRHDFVAVVAKNFSAALWAAERFKALHRPNVWQEMQKICGANSTRDYAQVLIDYGDMVCTKTKKIIELERILQGHAVQDLSGLLQKDVDRNLYDQWLISQLDLSK